MSSAPAVARSVAAGVLGLLACACQPVEFSVPVVGQFSNGVAAIGQATTRRDGQGWFSVQVPGRFQCQGTYNALSVKASLVVPVACSDGRRGEVVAAIQLDGLSGSGVARFNDGTTARFVFGNLTFEQAFGAGATAKTKRT
jgi:hypothetical protein